MADPQTPAPAPQSASSNAADAYLKELLTQYQRRGGITSAFGYDYAQGALQDATYRKKFMPKENDTYKDWLLRLEKEFPGINFVAGEKDIYNKDHEFAHKDTFNKFKNSYANAPDPNYNPATFEDSVNSAIDASIKYNTENNNSGYRTREQYLNDSEFMDRQKDLYDEQKRWLGVKDEFRNGQSFRSEENRNVVEPGAGKLATGPEEPDSNALLKAYAQTMLQPLNENDPQVTRIKQIAANSALRDARARGINGPLSVAHGQEMMTRAGTDLQTQRSQIGLSALSNSAQLDLGQQQLAQQAYDRQFQMEQAQAAQAYQRQLGQNQSIGGILGAVGGGVIGAVTPIGIGAGVGMGSQLGAGLGSLATPGMSYQSYNPPSLGRPRSSGGNSPYTGG